MDDLESFFWVLFWICIHYSGSGNQLRGTKYEDWNFDAPDKIADQKAGIVNNERDFLIKAKSAFTEFYQPLIPCVNEFRKVVFPTGSRWENENLALYGDMKKVLLEAMNNEATDD